MDLILIGTGFSIICLILSLIYSIELLNYSKLKASERHLWSFLTSYLLMICISFIIISVVEFFELMSDIAGEKLSLGLPNMFVYVSAVLPILIFAHVFAVIRAIKIMEFNVENFDLNRVGLLMIYVIAFWLLAAELPEHFPFVEIIVLLSELVYVASFPVLLLLLYFTLKEKRIEHAIVQLPLNSVDKLVGIPLASSIFSLAVFMGINGYMDEYNLLEAFSIAVFIISGELYRRSIFKMRRLFS